MNSLSKILLFMGRRRLAYLLRDNFTTPRAAGAVNGTAAEPGPGVRKVVDSANIVSIAGNKEISSTGATNQCDPYRNYSAQTRVAGKMLIANYATLSTGGTIAGGVLGWFTTASPTLWGSQDGGIFYYGGTRFSQSSTDKTGAQDTAALNTYYSHVLILRATGMFYLSKVTGTWVLRWKEDAGNNSPLYPGTASSAAGRYEFGISFIRIPITLWLPRPLLSTSGAMTWPTTDGLGHAETTGLGSGGSGLTMLDAGTWSVAGGYGLNTPVLGGEKIVDGGFDDASKWSSGVGWDVNITTPSKATKIAGVSGYLTTTSAITPVSNVWYYSSADAIITAGAVQLVFGGIYISLINGSAFGTVRATSANAFAVYGSSTFAGSLDRFSVKPIPNSSLFTNLQLSTTDIYAEQVIHALTVGTQVGIAMNLDRSFAALVNGGKSAGTAVIALKQVTGVAGVGLSTSDTITIAGTTYTIASTTGGANVAYDDTSKTQTVTLNADPGALSDGAKVGLDWASWNGVVGPYFDGIGNIKLDEVVAGVYTNRLSVATTFVADKRLIVRKIGAEYRVIFNEVLVAYTSLVAAAAMAGLYHGMFSTHPNNTIKSIVFYDTGNVSNLYSTLNQF